ncbi:MAG: protein kinase [Acidiferrobacterales bacterium]
MTQDQLNVLPPDYELHWYRIERVLGQGGFGITYLARDSNLDQLVAIKEYLPIEFAGRAPDNTVQPRSQDQQEGYAWGLERFISEAQTLAKFDHPSIVRVYSVFEHNNTAYMVMRYEQGENLQSRLDQGKTLHEGALMAILLPILDGLQEIHQAGFIHRDIKPDNIYIREDGSPVLLDFGSARLAVGKARTLTILIAPGYAPFEQYYNSSDEQGPWTDIYSLGATLYRAVAGEPPLDAIARSKGVLGSTQDVFVSATEVGRGRYSQRFLAAIDHALAFNERDRPQTIADWRIELVTGAAPDVNNTSAANPSEAPVDRTHPAESSGQAKVAEHSSTVQGEIGVGEHKVGVSLWFRVVIAVALLVALPLLGIVVWNQFLVVRPVPDKPPEEEQVAATPLPEDAAKVREAERLAKLEQDLAVLEKQMEERRKAEVAIAAREKKLREEEKRLKEDQQRLDEQKRKAAAEKRRKVAAARQREEKISRLLAAAEADLAGGRLSTPVGDNALEGYRNVLALDPENVNAKAGLARIVDRYIGFANQATERRAFNKAEGYLDKAATVDPNSEKVASARAYLATEKTAFEREQVAVAKPAVPTPARPTLEERLASAIAAYNARDYPEAFRELKPLADQGIPEASYHVGVMYDTGKGVARSEAEAFKWYRKAAEQNHSEAQNSLGVMYASGRGVPRNDGKAFQWYRRAAERCNTDAQINLGRMYAQGRGVTQSDFQAYAWYNVAAEAGNKIAKERRGAIAEKLQTVEREHARKLSRRYAHKCDKT